MLSLFWNEKKNVGHYFLGNLHNSSEATIVTSSLTLFTAFDPTCLVVGVGDDFEFLFVNESVFPPF
jgi:hypothetical protein